jgi:hypothetical protein
MEFFYLLERFAKYRFFEISTIDTNPIPFPKKKPGRTLIYFFLFLFSRIFEMEMNNDWKSKKIGIIGLGIMGRSMVELLTASGYQITGDSSHFESNFVCLKC